MNKPRVLLQLDGDAFASAFDALVAVDAGVDHLLQYARVDRDQLAALVQAAIFTRGPADLKQTALFFGGSNADLAEQLFVWAGDHFFGPLHVSRMCDPNGANTTAAAAILSVEGVIGPAGRQFLILGGTGPVGSRAARIAMSQGARVRIGSRSLERGQRTVEVLRASYPESAVELAEFRGPGDLARLAEGCDVILAAGAAGATFTRPEWLGQVGGLKVAVDLNAVPPAGLSGISPQDRAVARSGVTCFGALAVGGLKMKIHKACLRQLFENNQQSLNTEEIFLIGRSLTSPTRPD